MYRVVEALMEIARQTGVEFEFNAAVERIEVNGTSARGVVLADGRRFLVVAVCDGMGSAPHSSFGARLAAHAIVSRLGMVLERYPDDYEIQLRDLDRQKEFLDTITRIVSRYRRNEFDAPRHSTSRVDIGEMQCTMTFAITPAQPQSDGDQFHVIFGFVGDSPAFHFRDGDWLPIEPAKDNEGLFSSAANGLLGATEMLVAAVDVSVGENLLITSDGVGNFIKFDGKSTALGEALAQRWAKPVGMLDFVRDVAFETVSADDDRTAVVIWFGGDRS
jgi:hypothetical protein